MRELHTDDMRVTFTSAARANAMLRQTAGGFHPLPSFDNGAISVKPPTAPITPRHSPESQSVTPISEGVSSVLVKRGPIMVDWWPRGWIARDFTIWATEVDGGRMAWTTTCCR